MRCFKYGRSLCVLASEYYEEAMVIAKQRDEELARAISEGTQGQLGAFFGIPISIKDHLTEVGKTCTVGSTWMLSHYKA